MCDQHQRRLHRWPVMPPCPFTTRASNWKGGATTIFTHRSPCTPHTAPRSPPLPVPKPPTPAEQSSRVRAPLPTPRRLQPWRPPIARAMSKKPSSSNPLKQSKQSSGSQEPPLEPIVADLRPWVVDKFSAGFCDVSVMLGAGRMVLDAQRCGGGCLFWGLHDSLFSPCGASGAWCGAAPRHLDRVVFIWGPAGARWAP